MATTTSTSLQHLISPLVAEALFVASEKSIMRGLVRNFNVPANSGKIIQVPIYPKLTAATVAEGTPLTTGTAVTTTKKDLTLGENGVMVELTDLSEVTSETDVVRDLGSLLGTAIATKIDVDLITLFDDFTKIVGSPSETFTAAKLFEAVAELRNLGVPSTDLACVVHPYIAYDLKAGVSNTFGAGSGATTDVGNEAMRSGFIGKIAGVPVYESSNISDTSVAGDYKGAIFHRDAMGIAMLQDLKIETRRVPANRSTEIVATSVYGVSILHDTYGVELKMDSTLVNP